MEERSYWWGSAQAGNMEIGVLIWRVVELTVRRMRMGDEAWETAEAIKRASNSAVHEIKVVSTGETVRFTLDPARERMAVARRKKLRPKKSALGPSPAAWRNIR
jgi:hypothetical protein